MMIHDLLEQLKLVIILNPFEWSFFLFFIAWFSGGFLEYYLEWWHPMRPVERAIECDDDDPSGGRGDLWMTSNEKTCR